MSTYNIREKFSYVLASSSIDYVRNYNFNTTTVTDIPMVLSNSDDTLPITVNMTTTTSWLRIVDPTNNKDLRYPTGNIVLQPSSSTLVYVKIDLPPDIENIPESVIYPSITFDLISGSNLIESTEDTQNSAQNKLIVPSDIELKIGETKTIVIKSYDSTGAEEDGGQVEWTIENMSIAQLSQEATQFDEDLSRRIVRGISPGVTKIFYSAQNKNAETIVTVTNSVVAGNDPNVFCGQRCTSDSDCGRACDFCADQDELGRGICRDRTQL